MEKEMRKQVDSAIAKAKVRTAPEHSVVVLDLLELSLLVHRTLYVQESPMPDPSELFTNVYVSDCGLEVSRCQYQIQFVLLR
jgi:pyruvate dehydrogenase E1 component alpha subunit